MIEKVNQKLIKGMSYQNVMGFDIHYSLEIILQGDASIPEGSRTFKAIDEMYIILDDFDLTDHVSDGLVEEIEKQILTA